MSGGARQWSHRRRLAIATAAYAALAIYGSLAPLRMEARRAQATWDEYTLRMSAPGRQTQSLDFDAMSPPPKEVVLAPLAGAPEPPKPDKKLGPKTAPGAKPAPSSGSKSGGLKTDNIDPWDDK